jgi:hypothetical protein
MSANQRRSPIRAAADHAADKRAVHPGLPGAYLDPAATQFPLKTDRITPDAVRNRATSPVELRCPICGKRLPFSGPLSMLGTASVYCRNCRRVVKVTMAIAGEATQKPLENTM